MSPRVAYGLWIEGAGWLKRPGAEKAAARTFATTSLLTAERLAAFWGRGATVLPIDDSLIDLEDVLLEQRRPRQRTWREFWLRVKYGLL